MARADHKDYKADNYLLLKPDEVSAKEVFRLLWSKKMEKKAYIIIPEGVHEKLLENGLAITSLLTQKFLLHAFFKVPLRFFGQTFEMWLNLVSLNGNFFMLLLNILRCKVKIPNRKSEDFLSFLGHLDKRVKLDETIKPADVRYNSALAVMAAKLAYENKRFIKKTVEEVWKMEFIDKDYDFGNDYQERRNTQGFMCYDKRDNMIVVAFRGTEPFNAYDWSTDADLSCFENKEMGRIHGGFMKALGLIMESGWPPKLPREKKGKNLAYYSIREELRERLKANPGTKFILTGHSLGGALAILFPAILALHEETSLLERLEGVYTFGQPRVGDCKFKHYMEDQLDKYGIKYLRFVYCNDIIPRVPFDIDIAGVSLYKHFGTCLYFNSCYKGQILDEEPHKNFFWIFGFIQRFLSALWELLRTLYLPLVKGLEYRESLTLIFFRFWGLILPVGPVKGLVEHNPFDYVNTTRLGSIKVFEQVESSYKNKYKKTI